MSVIEYAYSGALAVILMLISIFDLRTWRIPDALNFALFSIGVLRGLTVDGASTSWGVASALIGFGAMWCIRAGYERVRGRTGLGLGDVKFVGASGPWIGLEGLPTLMLCASVLGLVYVSIRHMFHGRTSLIDRVPFGPFLALGLWLVWSYVSLTIPVSTMEW